VCYYNGIKCKTFAGKTAKRAAMKAHAYLCKENPDLSELSFDIRYKSNEEESYKIIGTRKKLDPPIKINGMEMLFSNKIELDKN